MSAGPQHEETGIGAIGGREQHVGVEKDAVHPTRQRSAPAWSFVSDSPGIDAQLPHGLDGRAVVLGVHGVGKEELGDPGGLIDLDRHRRSRPNQDAVVPLLGDDERSFFDPELTPHPDRDHDGAPLSHAARFLSGGVHPLCGRLFDCPIFGHTLILRGVAPAGDLGLARRSVRIGNRRQAREHLAATTTMYREMDVRFWLGPAEAELAKVRA